MIFHINIIINMKNHTEIVITKFNSDVNLTKKYNITQLINYY
jgi:hypothetical protein